MVADQSRLRWWLELEVFIQHHLNGYLIVQFGVIYNIPIYPLYLLAIISFWADKIFYKLYSLGLHLKLFEFSCYFEREREGYGEKWK